MVFLKHLKPILTLSVFFLQLFQIANGQMRKVYIDTISTNNEIKKISFYSNSEGYIASADDNINEWVGFTTDSGRTFVKKYITNIYYQNVYTSGSFFSINGVKAFNKNVIIAYGVYWTTPAILYSIDGGNSYEMTFYSQYDPQHLNDGITDMIFPENNNVGFAIDGDRVIKTTNQGLSWSVIKTEPQSLFDHLEAVDNNTVFAISTDYSANKLLVTRNGGLTWQTVTLPVLPGGKIKYAYFLTSSMGWLSMFDSNGISYLYKTNDGGASWTLQNDFVALYKLKFVDNNTGYALGWQNTVWKSFDSGITWEPLPRDNNFAYLSYSHTDLQCISSTQLWAGGNRDFLELSTNGGGTPLAKAFFKIDTAGVTTTGIVNLINYSRSGYTYKWFLNNTQISTSYNTSYNHNINRTVDTVKLIVSNGITSDTSEKYQYFSLPVKISSFTPTSGITGTMVTITGSNFTGVSKVLFGGIPATNFTVVSPTQINAFVGTGATGAVTVITSGGNGVLNGFTYYPLPLINLPTTISKSVLCKSESISILIQNTEQNVRYDFIDSLNNSYGFVISNGGPVVLNTSPISRSGNFSIKATRTNFSQSSTFTNKIFVLVEHTKSAFTANRINIATGEGVSFGNQSKDAQTFAWTFHEDASVNLSSSANPQNISYPSSGQKTLTLISNSANGCKDTLNSDAVFVYNKPTQDETCFAENIDDNDTPYFYTSFGPITLTADNGFIITGSGNMPLLKSRLGVSKQINQDGVAFITKYSTNGVLQWLLQIKNAGEFYATATDSKGNIYVIGSCAAYGYLTLVNGDSVRIAAAPNDSTSDRRDGFVLKLDSIGNYIWHTVIDDPTQGYPVKGGIPYVIKVKDDNIIIAGRFLAKLAYYRNGVLQNLVSLPNNGYENDLQNDFILSIRDDGSLKWHTYFENVATNLGRGIRGVGLDANLNAYITGVYEDKIEIHDAGNINRIVYTGFAGSNGSYLLKFDTSGRLLWNVDFKSVLTYDITISENGASYLTGLASNFQVINSNGSIATDSIGTFVVFKFDSSGIYKWCNGSISDYGLGKSIYLRGEDLFITGDFYYPTVDSGQFVLTSSDGNYLSQKFYTSEFFIVRYDTSGILKRIIRSGRNNGERPIAAVNLAIDSKNNFIIGGVADCTNDGVFSFIAFNNTTPIPINRVDGFYIKLDSDYCYSAIHPIANSGVDKVICSGDTVTIGTSVSGDAYYWTSSPAGFISTLPNPTVSPDTSTTYYLTVINQAGFIARDTVKISTIQTPLANAGPDQSICKGSTISIGTSSNTGYNYSWSSIPASFTSIIANPLVTPSETTEYYLAVANNSVCVGRDTVLVNVSDTYTPSVVIGASAPYVCANTNVTFTATATNGGINPNYQWQVNGINLATNSNLFSSSSLKNNDVIRVLLTSSYSCASPTSVFSNSIALWVFNSPVPGISITGNTTVISGGSSTVVSSEVNGGSLPRYQWQDSTKFHSWQNITSAVDIAISYTPAETGDRLRCILTSNAECAVSSTAISNVLMFIVNNVTAINPVSNYSSGIKYYPNPVNSILVLDSLKLSDKWQTLDIISQDGRPVIVSFNLANCSKALIMLDHLISGQYFAILRRRNGVSVYFKFIKL